MGRNRELPDLNEKLKKRVASLERKKKETEEENARQMSQTVEGKKKEIDTLNAKLKVAKDEADDVYEFKQMRS